jgi:hypothetical protein
MSFTDLRCDKNSREQLALLEKFWISTGKKCLVVNLCVEGRVTL